MKKTLEIVREIAMFVLILTCVFPGISNKILVVTSILIWLLMNFLIDKKECLFFFIKPNFLTYSVYFWLISSVVYIITRYDVQLQTYIFSYFRIGIISLIYYYYYKNNLVKRMNLIVIFSIVLLIIVNIITISANIQNYNLSRLLSTGLRQDINKIGIGTYPYIYGLIFALIASSSIIIIQLNEFRKKRNKINSGNYFICKTIGLVTFVITSLFTIYITEFSIAFFLLGFAVLLSLMLTKKLKLNLFELILIIIAIILLVIPIAREISKYIYENADSKNLKMRANDIYMFLLDGNTDNTIDLKARLDRYKKSINAFKDNILLGSMQYTDEYNQIGGHSEILDLLGKYGIIGSIPFLAYIICMYITIYKSFKSYFGKKVFVICCIVFTVFMLINTALVVAPIFMAFVLTPMILQVAENNLDNKKT